MRIFAARTIQMKIMSIDTVLTFLESCYKVCTDLVVTPNKRTYFLYMFTSLPLVYFIYKKKKKQSFIKFLLPKKIWLGKSAFVDYYFIAFNSVVKILLIAPLFIFGFKLAFHTTEYLNKWFGYELIQLSTVSTMIAYTIALSVFGDFVSYLIHLAMHKVPFLWEFHKTHHSATTMNPFTQYRIHPVELILNNLGAILTFGLMTGVFDYLSASQINKWTFAGVNIFTLIFNFWGANLRHSHVKFKFYNFLEYIFISPVQHQIHHSDKPEHYDKNLGSKFAFWDWIFGTLIRSKQVKKLHFGLGKKDNQNYASFLQNLLNPFKNILGNK